MPQEEEIVLGLFGGFKLKKIEKDTVGVNFGISLQRIWEAPRK